MSILFGESSPNNTQEPSFCINGVKLPFNVYARELLKKADTPHSNTGGNSPTDRIFVENFSGLRVSGVLSALSPYTPIRKRISIIKSISREKPIVRERKDVSVHVDTLSLTGKLETVEKVSRFRGEECINALDEKMQRELGLKISREVRSGRNFYKRSSEIEYTDGRLKKSLGFVAWGGNKETYQIYLTGEGMEYITANSLSIKLYGLAFDLDMRITRGDLAWDDVKGETSVIDAIKMYKNGEFKITRNPKIKQHGNFVTAHDEDGRTVEIGSRESGKLLRVYDKGKELGDKLSKWVRWEVEIHSKDRKIPLKMIVCPNLYFAGAYPALGKIVPTEAPEVIKTIKKKVEITLEKAVENVKTQSGKLINFLKMKGRSDSEIVNALIREEGIPARLVFPLPAVSTGKDETEIIESIPITSHVSGWEENPDLIPI